MRIGIVDVLIKKSEYLGAAKFGADAKHHSATEVRFLCLGLLLLRIHTLSAFLCTYADAKYEFIIQMARLTVTTV